MNPLEQILIDKIRKEGPIAFEMFMDMALYYPELGYYSSGKNLIGRKGDFYTSPHLHPVFGAMLAKQLMEMWMVMGKPKVFYAVEIGAGIGYLCKDILEYLHKPSGNIAVLENKNDFLKSLRYVIVEPYKHFEERQRDMLGDLVKDVAWVKSLKELNEKITGCIFSNELLDAFPVHLVEMEDELKEIYVDFDGRKFVDIKDRTSSVKLSNYLKEFSVILRSGYRTEINLRIKSWLEAAGAVLSKGFLLTIDYGYSAREYYSEERTKGTLLCYHRHQFNEDPYNNVGDQDITAHVNFSSLEKWGKEFGLQATGYCPQGTFLVSSGIDEIITELYSCASEYASEMAKIKGLIFPQGMGASHDVMVQYKGEGSPELRGFLLRNQKGML
jgi:SAM-dependent MidA family methyltransferase